MSELIRQPRRSRREIAVMCRAYLEQCVRIDSQSDETSEAIPSTEGQRELSGWVQNELRGSGAVVETDGYANLVARLPGKGKGTGLSPVAFMVHLDTSRGTRNVNSLQLVPSWDGSAIPFSANPQLRVDLETYPSVREFLGHDLLHGPGDAPFGLDDKLGLAQMLTLARLLKEEDRIDHPPLVLVARPDEEIGRMEAVRELSGTIAALGVRHGYTLDGILPFEINVENFNASAAAIDFPDRPLDTIPGPSGVRLARVRVGGVNTHGATAHAEGYRAATRLCAELVGRLEEQGLIPSSIVPVRFESDSSRDCDAVVELLIGGPDAETACAAWGRFQHELSEVIDPHVSRGASWKVSDPLPFDPATASPSRATWDLLRFVREFLTDSPGFVIPAEDSFGRLGYSAPYRAVPRDGSMRLDVRLRDFEESGLRAREQHVSSSAGRVPGATVSINRQYVNMGPALSEHPELTEWARAAASWIDAPVRADPIRGGTGVDPFLDQGIGIANLGTGYFAPESEKEFTSLQSMSKHVLWLVALVQLVADPSRRRS